MTNPKPNPKNQPTPSEFLKHLEAELKNFTALADIEGKKQRLLDENSSLQTTIDRRYEELKELDVNIAKRQNKFDRANEVAEAELKRRTDPIRREITQLEATAAKLKQDNASLHNQTDAANTELEIAYKTKTEIMGQIEDQNKLYEELAAKVGDQRDLQNHYKKILEEQKSLATKATAETEQAKAKRDETKADIKRELDEAKRKGDEQTRRVDSTLVRKRAELNETNRAITLATDADEQRQIDLKSKEAALNMKIKALQYDRAEFESAKRDYLASSRI